MPDSQLQTLPNGQKPMVSSPIGKHLSISKVKPVYTKRLGGYGALELCFRSASLSTWRPAAGVRYASRTIVSTRVSLPLRSLTLSIAVTRLPGQKVCPMRFDLPTQMVTMLNERMWHGLGKAGVSICSLENMKSDIGWYSFEQDVFP